jgi:molybdate-binding protein
VRPSVGIEAPARRLKLDFSPLLLEDYYLGKREAIEREDIEEIIARLKTPKFADHVRGVPGYDTTRTGEIINVSDVL